MLSCGIFAVVEYASGQTAKCTNTPAAGERVVCEKDASSGDDIEILLEGVDIDVTATAVNTYAVHAWHKGTGDIDIEVTQSLDEAGGAVGSTIDTTGSFQAFAVFGEHTGTGAIDITVFAATITTTGKTGHAVHGRHHGAGRISLDVSGSSIKTTMKDAHGVYASHQNDDAAEAGVSVTASSNRIVTEGDDAHAIRGTSYGRGDVAITSASNTITTKGKEARGIFGYHRGDGDTVIRSTGDTIVTEHHTAGEDSGADGILAWHQRGTGDIDIDVAGGSIRTSGERSMGVYGIHQGSGGIRIVAEGGQRIATAGASARGIMAYHAGSGGIRIALEAGSRIATAGAYASGIAAFHGGTGEDRSMDVAVGGIVETKGAGAHGVLIGIRREGNAAFAAAFDDEGYRRQAVTVTGRIDVRGGGAAGIFLAGGGRVHIGPAGVIDAAPRIAVFAAGDTPGENPGDPAVKPKLFVGIELSGRRMKDVLGDGWIINEGGETTIAVNGVVLHDGAKGVVPGARAPNGAWDVTVRKKGVNVAGRSDPENWEIAELAPGAAADRDFSAADFDFSQVYAPRAAVYEALPGFLLALHEPNTQGARISRFGSPAWVRLSGDGRRFEPARSSAAAKWDFSRDLLDAGLDIEFGETFSASVFGCNLWGSADISAPGGGGRIDARGTVGAFDLCATGPGGNYACGGFFYASYRLDISSDRRGLLKSGASARGHRLSFEAGRRLTTDGGTRLAPRIRMRRTKVEMDGFADAVNSLVWVRDASRVTGGIGLAAETEIGSDGAGGAFTLRGSADLERTFGPSRTRVVVSGEELVSEASRTNVSLGFGADYRLRGFSVGATLSATGSGSGDAFYSGMLTFRLTF